MKRNIPVEHTLQSRSARAIGAGMHRLRIFVWSIKVAVAALAMSGGGACAEMPVSEFFVGSPPYQMYVQRWAPAPEKPAHPMPVIMIHGGAHTGTAWTTSPDGQPGWAYRFSQSGWTVYVVDWPGIGRSGYRPETLTTGPSEVVDSLIALLERTGPAILVGHSIGGALSFKVAEKRPDLVRAIVALAPASVEKPNLVVPAAPLDKLVVPQRDAAFTRFANSEHFPKEAFENYFLSLVLYGPLIRNAAVGTSDDFKLDRNKIDIWKRIPVLLLAAEKDQTVPNSLTEETARVMGVDHTLLGRDWGRPGHGHLFIIERENQEIAKRVQAWLEKAVKRP